MHGIPVGYEDFRSSQSDYGNNKSSLPKRGRTLSQTIEDVRLDQARSQRFASNDVKKKNQRNKYESARNVSYIQQF